MSYGKIYETTYFGSTTNEISWGIAYRFLVITPLASTTRIFASTTRWLADNLFG